MALTYIKTSGLDPTSTFSFANVSLSGNIVPSSNNISTLGDSTHVFSNVYASSISGTLTSPAQPNITSVGSLTSLTVSGLITATAGGIKVGNLQDTSGTNTVQLLNSNMTVTGSITAGGGGSGNVTATYFIGDGSQLTNLPGGGSYVTRNYVADGSSNSYTITSGCSVDDVLVFVNGLCQAPTNDYTISGTTLTIDGTPVNGTKIQIRELPR